MSKEKELRAFSYYLEALAHAHSRHTVFDDFLTMIVCSLSMGKKEDEYLRTVKKYTKEEVDTFCKAYASLVMQMTNDPLNDPFGGYFEEYLYNDKNGQFFTPQSVSDLMAQLTLCRKEDKEKKSVNDPACGSGRLFLSVAKIDRNKYFVGADISLTCCKMTLINMCLNSLQGEVYHMDSLNLEVWQKWFVMVDPLLRIPCIYEVETPEANSQAPIQVSAKTEIEEAKVIEEISPVVARNNKGRGFIKYRANV